MKNRKFKLGIVMGIGAFLLTTNINAQSQERQQRGEKPPSIEALFKQIDANEDGKLSLNEIKGPLKDDFKTIDANDDGFITKKELEKAPKPKRKSRSRN